MKLLVRLYFPNGGEDEETVKGAPAEAMLEAFECVRAAVGYNGAIMGVISEKPPGYVSPDKPVLGTMDSPP